MWTQTCGGESARVHGVRSERPGGRGDRKGVQTDGSESECECVRETAKKNQMRAAAARGVRVQQQTHAARAARLADRHCERWPGRAALRRGHDDAPLDGLDRLSIAAFPHGGGCFAHRTRRALCRAWALHTQAFAGRCAAASRRTMYVCVGVFVGEGSPSGGGSSCQDTFAAKNSTVFRGPKLGRRGAYPRCPAQCWRGSAAVWLALWHTKFLGLCV